MKHSRRLRRLSVRVFGTDLGWTYEHDGTVTMRSTWHPYSVVLMQTHIETE